MIDIGFTGTRQGMTPEQLRTLLGILSGVGEIIQGHHGDCEGADAEFHTLVHALGGEIVLHPPDKGRFRAYCQHTVEEHPPKDYVPRNHDIVDDSKWVIDGTYIGMVCRHLKTKKWVATWNMIPTSSDAFPYPSKLDASDMLVAQATNLRRCR